MEIGVLHVFGFRARVGAPGEAYQCGFDIVKQG
jgi:hypothetical protein